MDIREYIVRLKHDKGFVSLRIAATSTDKAIELVCQIEKAPFSAVRSVRLAK
jgi:hypothetical protein